MKLAVNTGETCKQENTITDSLAGNQGMVIGDFWT